MPEDAVPLPVEHQLCGSLQQYALVPPVTASSRRENSSCSVGGQTLVRAPKAA